MQSPTASNTMLLAWGKQMTSHGVDLQLGHDHEKNPGAFGRIKIVTSWSA